MQRHTSNNNTDIIDYPEFEQVIVNEGESTENPDITLSYV